MRMDEGSQCAGGTDKTLLQPVLLHARGAIAGFPHHRTVRPAGKDDTGAGAGGGAQVEEKGEGTHLAQAQPAARDYPVDFFHQRGGIPFQRSEQRCFPPRG